MIAESAAVVEVQKDPSNLNHVIHGGPYHFLSEFLVKTVVIMIYPDVLIRVRCSGTISRGCHDLKVFVVEAVSGQVISS